ncbi:hypothetical protein ACOSP7_002613 [Xanthoceras sorbifolium]
MLTATEYSNHQGRLPEWTQIEQATPRVLTILSALADGLMSLNGHVSSCGGGTAARLGKSLNAFHGVRAPSISIPKYLERIYKYTNCSPSCFVVGYVYIDRLSHRHPDSLVVHYNNAFYARVGGVSNAELNKLELEVLFLLDLRVENIGGKLREQRV